MEKVEDIMKGYRKRNLEILRWVMGGKSHAEVARHMDLTRERIGQIIEELTGDRKPQTIPESGLEVDWEMLRAICKTLSIRARDIAKEASLAPSTVSHVWTTDERYLGHQAEFETLKVILELIQARVGAIAMLGEAVQYDRESC